MLKLRSRNERTGVGRSAAASAAVVMVAVALWGVVLPGCDRSPSYSQRTPDDVVKSAVLMVQRGEAHRLGDLIYADSPEMRAMLDRLGVLLGHMQDLARVVQEKFPDEIARRRAEAEAAVSGGGAGGGAAGSLMNTLRGRGGPGSRSAAKAAISELLVDPYGWIERNADRLSTLRMADDLAIVTADDRPVLAPVGVPIREFEGVWYVVLPTNMAPVSGVMPRTEEMWKILGAVVQVLDNTVVDLTADVRSGRIRDLRGIGEKAGEKALFPAMIAFAAYGRELDVHNRVDRYERRFRQRYRDWLASRGEGRGEVARPVQTAVDRIVRARLEEGVRKRERFDFEGMSGARFSDTLEDWLHDKGLRLSLLRADLNGEEASAAAERWLESGGSAVARGGR